jgi:2-polyprenyl-6-methoxyphenol hydroxylase-like FAD-dependent oxidoreductase
MDQSIESPHILIVGGGLAGLFCALESVRNGFRATVLESRAAVQAAGKKSEA